MTHRWLHLRLAAPLMAFGDVSIDYVGPTRAHPAQSALTGLLANALGLRRQDRAAHGALQVRLIFASLAVMPEGRHSPLVVTDMQNAKLEKSDRGWTTFGAPEGRAGATYDTPHRRRRDFLADHETRVVLRLNGTGPPTLEDVALALDRPARSLFIGRKPCLPSGPIRAGWTEGRSALDALRSLGYAGPALWPDDDHSGPAVTGALYLDRQDLRNWQSGLHAGSRAVAEGWIA
ncbi:type I-E CRISPR-associated protein Cas5/CasD [Roseivivax sediminis]|uniref:CRISPR-associated protein, Cas5e family n=1 Tax=Roseivivax sediminis TaxID=936889 RepID=A0A1I2EGW7_9RHOB|nr:type I-E CRISPR-associated protein Cas5/CasD [Roseivivax sediminis]SFE91718.1 CRISPR-associated protein, Cas5e family [Roseivivax sediminis]